MSFMTSATIWKGLSYPINAKPVPEGLDAIWSKGEGFIRKLMHNRNKPLLKRAQSIVSAGEVCARLSNKELQDQINAVRAKFRLGFEKKQDVDQALALVSEASFRTLGKRPYVVQIAGSLVIESGAIAEMATGEGKSITAAVAAVLAGWRGEGCHVITVNDYLASRDAEDLKPLYDFCNCSVAALTSELKPPKRREAYIADITYGSGKEMAADYLRDFLLRQKYKSLSHVIVSDDKALSTQIVTRGTACAIVDEVDSVLIDESITPLIISKEVGDEAVSEMYRQAHGIAEALVEGEDYTLDNENNQVTLKLEGKNNIAVRSTSLHGIWRSKRQREELVVQGLFAKHFFLKDHAYVVDDGKVIIVDESTGRLMPEHSWKNGLHQAVEAKEGVEITPGKETCARITFQKYYRQYKKLSGITGTAMEAEDEFWNIYRLAIIAIPTRKECPRIIYPPQIYRTEIEKWEAIASSVKEIHEQKRPVLIGTKNINDSIVLSAILREKGLGHRVLNATNHREEAQIVKDAGHIGSITVATNMAGRGTDIKLGEGVREIGGLHVIVSQMHNSARTDRQLVGRCSRQGDPGSAQFFISLADSLPSAKSGCMVKIPDVFYAVLPEPKRMQAFFGSFKRFQKTLSRKSRKRRQMLLQNDNSMFNMLSFSGDQWL